jgi:hypothetical protein
MRHFYIVSNLMPHTSLLNEIIKFEVRHLFFKEVLTVNLPLIESVYFNNKSDISIICFQFIEEKINKNETILF